MGKPKEPEDDKDKYNGPKKPEDDKDKDKYNGKPKEPELYKPVMECPWDKKGHTGDCGSKYPGKCNLKYFKVCGESFFNKVYNDVCKWQDAKQLIPMFTQKLVPLGNRLRRRTTLSVTPRTPSKNLTKSLWAVSSPMMNVIFQNAMPKPVSSHVTWLISRVLLLLVNSTSKLRNFITTT